MGTMPYGAIQTVLTIKIIVKYSMEGVGYERRKGARAELVY